MHVKINEPRLLTSINVILFIEGDIIYSDDNV